MIVCLENFATKIELVDFQHQQLLNILNRLIECFKQSVPSDKLINETLCELEAHANKHFVDEELLMLHNHMDNRHVRIHRMEHRSFLYEMQNLRGQLSASLGTKEALLEISEKLIRFINAWIIFHLLGLDQSMAAQIVAIQNGSSPQLAYNSLSTEKYDTEVKHLVLDSLEYLWLITMERCNKLEEELAALKQRKNNI